MHYLEIVAWKPSKETYILFLKLSQKWLLSDIFWILMTVVSRSIEQLQNGMKCDSMKRRFDRKMQMPDPQTACLTRVERTEVLSETIDFATKRASN